ncbi:MAG: hypothetical protein WCX10_09215 [Bacteroidales bacterium]
MNGGPEAPIRKDKKMTLLHVRAEPEGDPGDRRLSLTVVRQDRRVTALLPYRHEGTGVVLVAPKGTLPPSVTGTGRSRSLVVALRGDGCPLDRWGEPETGTVPDAAQACRRIREAVRALRAVAAGKPERR